VSLLIDIILPAPWVDSGIKRNEYQEYFLGSWFDNLATFMCRFPKSGSLNLLEAYGPKPACIGIGLPSCYRMCRCVVVNRTVFWACLTQKYVTRSFVGKYLMEMHFPEHFILLGRCGLYQSTTAPMYAILQQIFIKHA